VVRLASRAPFTDILAALTEKRLIWVPEAGFGYYPVDLTKLPYDCAYFERYAAYADTPMGLALNTARNALVARHWKGPLVDVGIGSGSFVRSRRNTLGYDINPSAVAWLKTNGLWSDPYDVGALAVSMWDVLEHIQDFPTLLADVAHRVFVSMPVFVDCEDILSSRHYRPDEHFWYFTVKGFTSTMRDFGWKLLETNRDETDLGREGIASFAFGRV
jgi:hypothetical protein